MSKGRTTRADLGPRPKSISRKRKREARPLLVIAEERPKLRSECKGGARPCPWVSCRHHLAVEVTQVAGSMKLIFPGKSLAEMEDTCSLDVADRGALTLDELGKTLNVSRERARQLVNEALKEMRKVMKEL